MIIHVESLHSIHNLLSLVHNESAECESTLEIQFAGHVPIISDQHNTTPDTYEWGTPWLDYMAPITLMRAGTPIFHGKVTSYSHSDDEGTLRTSVTATDAIWLLDHQPFAAQIADIKASIAAQAQDNYCSNSRYSANQGMTTWASLAQSINLDAPGWACDDAGTPLQDAIISVDISRASYAVSGYLDKDAVITSWGALLKMRTSNPDALIHARPNGTIEIVSIRLAPELNWSQPSLPLMADSDISPRFADQLNGVAVIVNWDYTDVNSTNGSTTHSAGTIMGSYPEDLDITQSNIKIFTSTVERPEWAYAQKDHMMAQAKAYYDACHELQWSGSLRLPISSLPTSPLLHRINLTGTSTHPDWATMRAIISSISWDYVSGIADITLGMSISDPEIHTLEFQPPEEGSSSEPDPGGGGVESEPDPGEDPNWQYSNRSHHSSPLGTFTPPGGTNNPPRGTHNPPAGPHNPPAGTNNPPLGTNNPPAGTNNPPAGTNNPPLGTNNPPAGTNNLPAGTNNLPGTGACNCAAKLQELEDRIKKLEDSLEDLLSKIKEALLEAATEAIRAYTLQCDVITSTGAQTIRGEARARITAKISPAKNTEPPPDGDYILSRYGDYPTSSGSDTNN